ncbi:alpha/beta hydrolase [Nocardioides pocheonensis]|uniref:Alpha/beta hydrolase n=1 Tax=Nocardioides pocheonensis TaxID=661485 RepID=A0A3N0GX71_9ACTN|nr:alpha/beta hydrolase [Nocardioides pocheonensis]RNM17074.1 alpha/beta hydrolase [Nocardioides pocheonensis]
MPIDPSAQAVLDILTAPGVPPLDELPPAEARQAYDGLAAFAGEPVAVARTLDLEADGVPVRLYWPQGAGDEPLPVVVWNHGGGFVMGSLDGYDAVVRALCAATGCLVVSVDYRLAPEHPFPAQVDDAQAVARWVHAHIAEHGGDPDRMVAAGDSAGGTLSAVLGHQLHGMFRLQVLLYPMTDLTMSQPSIEENAERYLLTRNACNYFRAQYLGDYGDLKDPLASPLFADDTQLAGAPPALVVTAELDPLRDEGEAYAARLCEAGVPVEHVRFDGMIHAFFTLGAMVPAAHEALDLVAAAVRRATA